MIRSGACMSSKVFVIGTFDTKGEELNYVTDLLLTKGISVARVDVSTQSSTSDVEIDASAVAATHPTGKEAVFAAGDRGLAVTAMAEAAAAFFARRSDVAGLLGLGGSGGTTIVTAAMRAMPLGIPKMVVSTVASGNIGSYVGTSDITMMYSVTDLAGLNRLSRRILANAAHGLAGMLQSEPPIAEDDRPSLGLTMFGVTTPGVQKVTGLLKKQFDCQVFHATGAGGRALEALAAAGMLDGLLDLTTTEVADNLMGGICSAGPGRLDVLAQTGIPWIGSCGALDMVNFGPRESVPERYADRQLHVHNPNVTLMRTTPQENVRIGEWMAQKLNASPGPVHLLLPEGGLSMLDAPGQPFWVPEADEALFTALEAHFKSTEDHSIRRVPFHINDAGFAEVVAGLVADVMEERPRA